MADHDPKAESQLDKFKVAARTLETDDDPEHFKERLGKLVKKSQALRGHSNDLIEDAHKLIKQKGKPTNS